MKFNIENTVNEKNDVINNTFNDLRTNSNGIEILTPTASIYQKPTYGYYPGTNSFDNDIVGAEPAWFQEVVTTGGTVQVIDELDGHYSVVELYDTSITQNAQVVRDLLVFPQYGTIEYWMRTDNTSNVCGFRLEGGIIPIEVVTLRTWENMLQRYNGTEWNNVSILWENTLNNNRWYHIRIDFECTTGAYRGLAQYTWQLYINGGAGYGNFPFINNRSFTNGIVWYTDWLHGQSDYHYYIDAVGFSWDDYYAVADNTNEGLLLSFQGPSNLTWMVYSLDGGPNKTILGDIAIPKPGRGSHSIQVFGEDSENNKYTSGIRNFVVQNPSCLMIGGMGGSSDALGMSIIGSFLDNNENGISDFVDYYGFPFMQWISYYENTSSRPEFIGVHGKSSIRIMAEAIKNYIINEYIAGNITNRIDLIGYSQGGVVIRSLIYQFHDELKEAGITINHAAIMGSPCHGCWGFNKFALDNWNNMTEEKRERAGYQMSTLSEFLDELNSGDETHYNILFSTYAGIKMKNATHYEPSTFLATILWIEQMYHRYTSTIPNFWEIMGEIYSIIGDKYDGAVETKSVALVGATNNRVYIGPTHTALHQEYIHKDLLCDLKYYAKPEITITSPKNQTNYAPMNGYFLASNGFENDGIGWQPEWFTERNTQGGTLRVLEEIAGHKNVLEIYDSSTSLLNAHVRKILPSNPTYGTVEYWMRADDASKMCGFRIDQGLISNEMVTMRTFFNVLQYYNGTDWNNIRFIYNNTWYHIRIDFTCATGGYQGLAPYTWRLFVNGIQYGDFPFANNQDFAYRLVWYNDWLYGMTDYRYYIDAIGLSWDSNYNVGDNLNEGLLLSIEKNFEHNWISYSLDGQSPKTILGSMVLPIPVDGHHTIQVFSEDFSGEAVQSNLIHFELDTTPPEITIQSPVSNELFGKDAPEFSITIIEPNLQNRWYSLDGGTTNIFFTGFTERISQDEWDKFGNGTVTLTIFVSDLGDHINSTEVILRKDILAPEIIIYAPIEGEEFDEIPPSFNISVDDPNGVALTWYSLDAGLTNTTFSGSIGEINEDIWQATPIGPVIIRIYARDTLGNEQFLEVGIIKTAPKSPSPAIPGYVILIILGFSILGSIVICKKSKRILNY